MSPRPRGYDLVISKEAADQIASCDEFHTWLAGQALDLLLLNPTPHNPIVQPRATPPGANPQFVLRLGELSVYFEMQNALVATVLALRFPPEGSSRRTP